MKKSNGFISDVEAIRERARKEIEKGAVTESYGLDKEAVIDLCNQALATETVCVLRYKRHYFMAEGIHADPVAKEFLQHANEEQMHADKLAERITQLGGKPDLNPAGLAAKSHTEYIEGESLLDMVKEDLVAERIVIDIYRESIRFLGDQDPTTRKVFEEILANEEEHASDLTKILAAMNPTQPVA
jgi:bacterioferritin